jgi:hypothetical protein
MIKLKTVGLILSFLSLPLLANSQMRIHGQAGLSYIEHFSIGAGVSLRNHSLSLLYGSNFFVQPKKFSNYFLQYALAIPRAQFSKLIPLAGVKGGQTFFSDHYYTWDVVSLIPFVGIQTKMTEQIDLSLQTGVAFSFEQSVTRLNFGEIGHYKDTLPELKLAVIYKLMRGAK